MKSNKTSAIKIIQGLILICVCTKELQKHSCKKYFQKVFKYSNLNLHVKSFQNTFILLL